MNIIERAKARWNTSVDEFHQWKFLGFDEIEILINREIEPIITDISILINQIELLHNALTELGMENLTKQLINETNNLKEKIT